MLSGHDQRALFSEGNHHRADAFVQQFPRGVLHTRVLIHDPIRQHAEFRPVRREHGDFLQELST